MIQQKLVIVDVGSACGINKNFDNLLPFSKGIITDPNDQKININDYKDFLISDKILWDKEEKREFFFTRWRHNSSLRKVNTDNLKLCGEEYLKRFEVEYSEQINTTTLDNLIKEASLDSEIDLLKIDTEGCGYEVLKGGLNSLGKTVFVEVEVEFREFFQDQKLFTDVNNLLDKNNFQLFDIQRIFTQQAIHEKMDSIPNNFKGYTTKYSHCKGSLFSGNALYINKNYLEDTFKTNQYKKFVLFVLFGRPDLAEITLNKITQDNKNKYIFSLMQKSLNLFLHNNKFKKLICHNNFLYRVVNKINKKYINSLNANTSDQDFGDNPYGY